jgi:hypothetical protein
MLAEDVAATVDREPGEEESKARIFIVHQPKGRAYSPFNDVITRVPSSSLNSPRESFHSACFVALLCLPRSYSVIFAGW